MMDIAARSLKTKREVITRLLDEGLYPYTKRYLGTFENHFSTIGLIGMNEAGQHRQVVDVNIRVAVCLGDLVKEGLGGINGKITSSPARHLSVLCNQMVNFLGIMQNEWAGAQAFSSFDTYPVRSSRV